MKTSLVPATLLARRHAGRPAAAVARPSKRTADTRPAVDVRVVRAGSAAGRAARAARARDRARRGHDRGTHAGTAHRAAAARGRAFPAGTDAGAFDAPETRAALDGAQAGLAAATLQRDLARKQELAHGLALRDARRGAARARRRAGRASRRRGRLGAGPGAGRPDALRHRDRSAIRGRRGAPARRTSAPRWARASHCSTFVPTRSVRSPRRCPSPSSDVSPIAESPCRWAKVPGGRRALARVDGMTDFSTRSRVARFRLAQAGGLESGAFARVRLAATPRAAHTAVPVRDGARERTRAPGQPRRRIRRRGRHCAAALASHRAASGATASRCWRGSAPVKTSSSRPRGSRTAARCGWRGDPAAPIGGPRGAHRRHLPPLQPDAAHDRRLDPAGPARAWRRCRARRNRRSRCPWSTCRSRGPAPPWRRSNASSRPRSSGSCGRSPTSNTSTRSRARTAAVLILRFKVGFDPDQALTRVRTRLDEAARPAASGCACRERLAACDRRRAGAGADTDEPRLEPGRERPAPGRLRSWRRNCARPRASRAFACSAASPARCVLLRTRRA